MRATLMMLVAVLVAGVFAASGTARAADPDGRRLYARMCASCHGADGSGNAAMANGALHVDPQLLDLGRPEAAGITREEKLQTLLKGKGKMPAYEGKLKPEQVQPVLDYTLQLTDALRKK